MLSILILIPLALCNAQWPMQNIGYDDVQSGPSPWSLSQLGYPYDERMQGNIKLPENADGTDLNLFNVAKSLHMSDGAKVMRTADGRGNDLLDESESLFLTIPSRDGKTIIELSDNTTIKEEVTKFVNEIPSLRNNTDLLVEQINLLYLNLAINEADNEMRTENTYKYGMSVILRFLLEFYRIFRKLSSQSTQLRMMEIDVYGLSYDKAIDIMKERKEYTPLQLSAPVRRSADIFKSILYESVLIVQTKCSALDPNWKCILLYLANMISESINCPNAWFHAFAHLLALDVRSHSQDSIIYKIADFDKFKNLTYFDNIFDFVIEQLQNYREKGRAQLYTEALVFAAITKLQEAGSFDCLGIDAMSVLY